ncbi:MAG TPA: T9SS type A sorting domain-containing protein [Flavobacteriales bacterium]|nr:T9SS type A sorting domain-containing protein [Flavobacteriales bacterium]
MKREFPITPTIKSRSSLRALTTLAFGLTMFLVHAQAPSNACGTALANEYPVGTTCSYNDFDKPGSFTATYNPATCNSDNNDDAWGWFTATGTTATVTFDPDDNHDPILHVFSGACGSLSQEGCADAAGNGGNETVAIATTPGSTYFIRVQRDNTNNAMNGRLCIVAPPANDDPCQAVSLPVNSSCVNTAGTNSSATATAGIPAPGCANYSGSDVWFSFVAPATPEPVTISTTAGSLTDGALALYSATACAGTYTLIECDDDDGPGYMPEIIRSGLTAGVTYYVRVWGYNGATGSFDICVSIPPAPANDDPCSAVTLTLNSNCSYTSGSNQSGTATAGIPAPGCASYSNADVWFSFVAPASGEATIRTNAGTLTNGGLAVYSATACAGTYTLLECDDDDGPGDMGEITRTGLTPGNTYYIRVWGNGGGTGTFGICLTVPPPANDEPCGAIALTPTSSCTVLAATNVGASASTAQPDPGCGGTPSNDVWYSVVVPANGFLTLRATPGTMTDPAMAVYSATGCDGTFNLLDCDDDDASGLGSIITLSPGGVTPGATYYVRVWSASGGAGTFNLCAETPSASCFMAVRMFDTNDNGWGSSRLTIQVGAAAAVNYWLPDQAEDVVYLPFTDGQLVQVSYATGGSGGQSQISYMIQIGAGILFADGPTPTTGLVHASTLSCSPIAAPTSDCSGGERLCGGTAFSGNPSNTGAVSDLNLHTRGCLSSNERQGNWYYIIPSASGTIGMTIAPSDTDDDYDFAVWGPSTSKTCPPMAAPYRCSYSGDTGNTGMGNGASDPTENHLGDKWVAPIDVTLGEYYVLYVSNYSRSGLSFDLSWSLTNGASLDCAILPVELLSFTGEAQDRSVILEWITASESNSSHFVVERSTNGYQFNGIGEVDAAGNSSSLVEYAFLDPSPQRGINYYRLKQVDIDGTTELSDIVAIRFDQLVDAGAPYPNPTHDQVKLDLELALEKELVFAVLDASGRTIHQERRQFAAGAATFRTDVAGLNPGVYLLHVSDANGETYRTGRFVVE